MCFETRHECTEIYIQRREPERSEAAQIREFPKELLILHDQGSSAHTEKTVVSQGHKLLSASSDAEKLFCEVSALFPSHKNEP